jgi:hypothetical protein
MGGLGWIDVAWDRDQWKALVNAVLNLRVAFYFGEMSSICATGCSRSQLHSIVPCKGIRHNCLLFIRHKVAQVIYEGRFVRHVLPSNQAVHKDTVCVNWASWRDKALSNSRWLKPNNECLVLKERLLEFCKAHLLLCVPWIISTCLPLIS